MRRQDAIIVARKIELARDLVRKLLPEDGSAIPRVEIVKIARLLGRHRKWVLRQTVDIRNPGLERVDPPKIPPPDRLKGDASRSCEMPLLSENKLVRKQQVADCLAWWGGAKT